MTWVYVAPILLLTVSNVFMTFAWYAHLRHLSQRPWIVAALASWGIALFEYLIQVPANRVFASLSGGERQRVLVARALTQQAPVLLLDEPTNHLDIGSQHDLLELVRDLGLTTIAALHDLDHATAYCDNLVLLDTGTVIAAGDPATVLTEDRVSEVFGVHSAIVSHPLTGRPHFVTAPAAENGQTSPDQAGE